MRFIFIILSFFIFFSCSKEDKTPQQNNPQRIQQEDSDEPLDTNLTPEEKFSSSILIDFLNDSDDEELAGYLETEIYKMGATFTGASVMEISPAIWLVMLDKDGNSKNYLLQKYVDFQSNEVYFRMKETSLTVTDVISRSKPIVPAGK